MITGGLQQYVADQGFADSLLHFGAKTTFDREAPCFEEAILSAIKDIKRADVGARVAWVEPGDFVTAAEIARGVGKPREPASRTSMQPLSRGPTCDATTADGFSLRVLEGKNQPPAPTKGNAAE